jgi:hypothetical protein
MYAWFLGHDFDGMVAPQPRCFGPDFGLEAMILAHAALHLEVLDEEVIHDDLAADGLGLLLGLTLFTLTPLGHVVRPPA